MMRISHFSHFDKRETFSQINVKAYVSVIILEVAMDGSFLFFIGHISDAQKGKKFGFSFLDLVYFEYFLK